MKNFLSKKSVANSNLDELKEIVSTKNFKMILEITRTVPQRLSNALGEYVTYLLYGYKHIYVGQTDNLQLRLMPAKYSSVAWKVLKSSNNFSWKGMHVIILGRYNTRAAAEKAETDWIDRLDSFCYKPHGLNNLAVDNKNYTRSVPVKVVKVSKVPHFMIEMASINANCKMERMFMDTTEIAKLFGVSKQSVTSALLGKTNLRGYQFIPVIDGVPVREAVPAKCIRKTKNQLCVLVKPDGTSVKYPSYKEVMAAEGMTYYQAKKQSKLETIIK